MFESIFAEVVQPALAACALRPADAFRIFCKVAWSRWLGPPLTLMGNKVSM